MDQAREALFNVLANRIVFSEQKVLDLFGGTGSIGLEFISRGCSNVVFVDKFPGCVYYAQKLRKELNLEEIWTIRKADARKFLKNCTTRFTLIVMDPPYEYKYYDEVVDMVFEHGLLVRHGLLIVEHDSRQDFSLHGAFLEQRNYGESFFSFFIQPGT